MVTAEELTVAIRSEGVSETQGDLEGVESAMEDTADSAGTAADDLEGFSRRFQGAMSAAIAGLAVAWPVLPRPFRLLVSCSLDSVQSLKRCSFRLIDLPARWAWVG